MTDDRKLPGKFVKEWNLAETKGKNRVYLTTTILKEKANLLEYWSPMLLSDKKIPNNSAFAAGRYILENGIDAVDTMMRAKFGARQVA